MVDPAVAVAITLAEAEMLRIQATCMLSAETTDEAFVRDLSPLGRGYSPRPV